MKLVENWEKDPSLADIAPEKLSFLSMLFEKGSSLSPKEMMPFLMSIARQSSDHKIAFEKEELQRILQVLEKDATQEELAKIQKAMKMMESKTPKPQN